MTIGGVTVIAFSPLEIIDDPAAFAHDVAAFLVSVGKRDLPPGMTFNRAA